MVFVIRFVWYELVSFEIRKCEPRKESRWLSYLSYSVVKEPTSAKGRLDCQTPSLRVKRNISCWEKKLRLTRKLEIR